MLFLVAVHGFVGLLRDACVFVSGLCMRTSLARDGATLPHALFTKCIVQEVVAVATVTMVLDSGWCIAVHH